MMLVLVVQVKNTNSVMAVSSTNAKKHLDVAVGVLIDDSKKILVALRDSDAAQGGLWEFPGGKIEKDETSFQGLQRELREEIGIAVQEASPLREIHYQYPEYSVTLFTFQVTCYQHDPYGREGQRLEWVDFSELETLQLPGANTEIVSMIAELL